MSRGRDRPTKPTEAGEEDQLQLSDHRTSDPHEQVVEATVLEVVFDPGSADPADSSVDDDELAMVDVPQATQVPASRAVGSERAELCSGLRRSDDADIDTRSNEPVVELPRPPLGVGALAVDDEPNQNALGRLLDQRVGEGVADDAGPEAELVDVDGGRRRSDVLEHRRVEVPPLDMDVD